MSRRSKSVDSHRLSAPKGDHQTMSKEVEWECPNCHQGYLVAVALMKKEKQYHKGEVSDL